MNTGTVLYLADVSRIAAADPAELPGELGLNPEWTEIAASAPGWPSVPDALLRLVERGAGRVGLCFARPGPEGRPELSLVRERLFG
ncbi:MAG: hypothetical protein D6708_06565 [Candidatus Dadabacteria bacterium]|nr:MAG: hypothetical protein D6708_06565 [Candidatus Dadabacteria bacterium]